MASPGVSVGSQILAILRAYGVSAIFSSPGSEWAPLWDAVAEAEALGTGPAYFNTRHEELAGAMAVGHYRQTNHLPALVLHTTVGTLKAAMVLRTALHERVPMVVLAGESSSFGEQPGYDAGAQFQRSLGDLGGPAALVGPFVKRSQHVTCPEALPGMLQDACRVALSPPCGPVFLSVPMEFMLVPGRPISGPLAPPVWRSWPDPRELDRAGEVLLEAERPLIVTETAGREPGNVQKLVDLAEALAIPVVERGPACVNFPREHPLHQGFDADPLLAEADVVVLASCVTPWYPASARPFGVRHVLLLDDYPTYELLPYWGVGIDQCVGGDVSEALAGLGQRVRDALAGRSAQGEAVRARAASLAERHSRQQAAQRAELQEARDAWPIDSRWLAACLAELLPRDAILVPEVTTDKANVTRFCGRSEPGTFQCRMTGGLGVGLGMAMGFKLGAPERLVVSILGDGAFHYNPALAALGWAQEYQLPILTVICNNGGYAAMKAAHERYYPDGWGVRTGLFVGGPIRPAPKYAALAGAYGGWGRRVESLAELRPVLEEGLECVRGGQSALIDVPTRSGRSRGR